MVRVNFFILDTNKLRILQQAQPESARDNSNLGPFPDPSILVQGTDKVQVSECYVVLKQLLRRAVRKADRYSLAARS